MARRKKPTRKTYKPPKYSECPFCKKGVDPDYKDYKELGKFMTDRAKIIGRARSGVCSKHQRKLGVAIKRARHLGLLPFSAGV